MPFTPFHLGPGIAIKAAAPRHVSLGMFAGAQVAMDLEPAIGMLSGAATLHGITHTLPGALVVALACLPFKRLAEWVFSVSISWQQAITGTLLGTYTHVLLDSLVHHDIRPLWPLSDANPLQNLLSWHETEVLCGVLALAAIRWLPEGWRRLRAMPWR
jgi:membrane-bound metal-dependent hydrolase YbcI (DUF457 family)